MRSFVVRLAALGALAAGPAQAAYTGLYVFGDSLSDRGNLAALTAAASAGVSVVPTPPTYAGGQFSNGAVWVEGLSQRLGLGASRPSLLGGTVHAFGFARTDSVPSLPLIPVSINLPGQVDGYIAGPAAPAGSLFAVWAGANNLLQALAAAPAQPDPTAYLAAETASAVAGTLAQIGRLVADGAQELLVLNLPNLGLTPRFNTNPVALTAGQQASQGFNTGLAAGLGAIDAIPGVRVMTLDVYRLFERVVATPAAFGFVNTSSACVTGAVPAIYLSPLAATQNCTAAQAAASLFWDPIHPTAAVHELIAAFAAQAVPAPAAAGLFLLGLAGIVALRRRDTKLS